MALDLESIRKEMEAHLEKAGVLVFYGFHRTIGSNIQVIWDVARRPDFREFLGIAQKAGAKMIVFHQEQFALDQIHHALDELEHSDFTREEKRHYESRLKQLQAYEGFTCSVQLSFSVENTVYLFELATDWYTALSDILSELDAAAGDFGQEDEEEEGREGPIGGYFSNN